MRASTPASLGPLRALLASLAVAAVFLAMPTAAGAVTQTFAFIPSPQTFTVPDGVTQVTIDAFGAQGGTSDVGATGGLGGRAVATVPVIPGEVLQVRVGGQPPGVVHYADGYNGGGLGGDPFGEFGGGGGGASDVRQGGTGLDDRIVVAGGGGGGGGSAGPCTGGDGGGIEGGAGSTCSGQEGSGGTQSDGGSHGSASGLDGVKGSGGHGGSVLGPGRGGGGGGGGLYGGGGGAGDGSATNAGGGGGGSGYTPDGTGMTNGVRAGHGEVTITYELPREPEPEPEAGDAEPPHTTITSAPRKPRHKHSYVSFTSSEPNSTFRCSLDGAPFAPCSSPQDFRNLRRGSHTLAVFAVDQAGNPDPTPAEAEWRVKRRR